MTKRILPMVGLLLIAYSWISIRSEAARDQRCIERGGDYVARRCIGGVWHLSDAEVRALRGAPARETK